MFLGGRGDVKQQMGAALVNWIHQERGRGEAVLVLCGPKTVYDLWQFLQGSVQQCQVGFMGSEHAANSTALSSFLAGNLDILVAPFTLGGRGLDYSGTAGCLQLAVIIFEFPPTVVDYVHAIGRTMRPGQRGGRAVSFLPEFCFWAVPELIEIFKNCGQEVPASLRKQNEEDEQFLNLCRSALCSLEAGSLQQDGAPLGSVDGDLWTLPSDIPSYRRRLLHVLSGVLGLPHVSTGVEPDRTLHFARDRARLPEKYFELGEKVEVKVEGEFARRLCGKIIHHKIHPFKRTVKVLLDNGHPDEFSVDNINLCLDSEE